MSTESRARLEELEGRAGNKDGELVDAALKPIFDRADRLDADPETQSLLRAIAQHERSTLESLREACALFDRA
jgi:hypothetical protein